MARPRKTDVDGTGVAQARFVVSLPKDLGDQIDVVSQNLAEMLRQQTGVAVELSRAKVIESLVISALRTMNEAQSASDADSNGAAVETAVTE